MPGSEKTSYLPIDNSSSDAVFASDRTRRALQPGKILVAIGVGLLVLTQTSFIHVIQQGRAVAPVAPPLGFPEKIQRRWGQYSPYFPSGGYVMPPEGCEITQVNIVRAYLYML